MLLLLFICLMPSGKYVMHIQDDVAMVSGVKLNGKWCRWYACMLYKLEIGK